MTDLMLPIGYVDDKNVIAKMGKAVSTGARGMKEANSIVEMLGGDPRFKPTAPILLIGPDGRTPILIIGDGMTEAAELQDMAMAAIGKQEDEIAAHGRGMDYDKLREKHGAIRRDKVGMAISDAIAARIAHHKQNPVTDPFRQPLRPQLARQFALGAIEEKKE